jgi:hypothetical protein
MGPLSYKRSVFDRNVVMRRIPVMLSALTDFVKSAAWQSYVFIVSLNNFFFVYWRYNALWVCILQPSSGL